MLNKSNLAFLKVVYGSGNFSLAFWAVFRIWQFNCRFGSNHKSDIAFLFPAFHTLPAPVMFCRVPSIYPNECRSAHVSGSRN